jgi:hypothetical protein
MSIKSVELAKKNVETAEVNVYNERIKLYREMSITYGGKWCIVSLRQSEDFTSCACPVLGKNATGFFSIVNITGVTQEGINAFTLSSGRIILPLLTQVKVIQDPTLNRDESNIAK